MNEPKFNKGDLVHIVDDPLFTFYEDMLQPGTIAKVTNIVAIHDHYGYMLDNGSYIYNENVLEPVRSTVIKYERSTNDDILFELLKGLEDIRNTLSRLLSKCGYE